ncbi:hypothetical protein L6Q96_03230 [Candidatus Binatia bacterium]|nr:hypothetical protein [Candidatus Binatia bacterium]
MKERQPLRFLLADEPGAGKTIIQTTCAGGLTTPRLRYDGQTTIARDGMIQPLPV